MQARAATETFMYAHWDVEIYYMGPQNLGQKEGGGLLCWLLQLLQPLSLIPWLLQRWPIQSR